MNAPTHGSERRFYPRRPLRCTASVHVSPTESYRIRTLDISPGGMAIITEHNPRVGTKLPIRMLLPARPKGTVPIEVVGEVMNTFLSLHDSGFKIGLRFVAVDAAAAAAIDEYVK